MTKLLKLDDLYKYQLGINYLCIKLHTSNYTKYVINVFTN